MSVLFANWYFLTGLSSGFLYDDKHGFGYNKDGDLVIVTPHASTFTKGMLKTFFTHPPVPRTKFQPRRTGNETFHIMFCLWWAQNSQILTANHHEKKTKIYRYDRVRVDGWEWLEYMYAVCGRENFCIRKKKLWKFHFLDTCGLGSPHSSTQET